MTTQEIIKQWIIDILDKTDKRNFDHNIGVVDGMERVMRFCLNVDTDTNKDIQAAYARMNARLFPDLD